LNHPIPEFGGLEVRAQRELSALPWVNTFGRLPSPFYTRLPPQPLPEPYLVCVSDGAMRDMGLDPGLARSAEFVAIFSGNRIAPGADPLAAVYAGHQFGVYVPRLGDGRAILLGGLRTPDGSVQELQLKGSGVTPYSRMADGRAVLRSSIREFLGSEAMYALGVPTTRALSVIGSPAPVIRESVETAAVVTRVAPSFVRFGTFEYFCWQQQPALLRQLADYLIDGFYPQCRETAHPYLELLRGVSRRTARLVARWQALGFCHGVLNTDNLSALGLTLDYGPFGFIDRFDAGHICNHSDDFGRYAFDRQPSIAYWNLRCLGQAMLPLTADADATLGALDAFQPEFERAMIEAFRDKLGLAVERPDDVGLVERTVDMLHRHRVDWTSFWRRLAELRRSTPAGAGPDPLRDLGVPAEELQAWMQQYRARLTQEPASDEERRCRMRRVNPKYVLRNHLAERAIAAARGDDGVADFSEIARLLRCLQRPFDDQPEFDAYALPPDSAAQPVCVSCSS
jgi:serine/tyrosine/threonine adenylyltransferase